jgi:SAM-dependent methyltransferase
MKASEYTKIINNLQDCQRILKMDGQDEDPSINELIQHYLDLRKPSVEQLKIPAEIMRDKLSRLSRDSRIKLFDDWRPRENVIEHYVNVISTLINWEYPCMEIFPGDGSCTQHMLGAEPLYIVDWSQELLDKVGSQFHEFYSEKRLMKYVIKDYDLSSLPQHSFGFIVCVNWLRFEDIHGLNRLSKAVYDCLMPGGRFLFAYNASDLWWGVDNIERGYADGVDSRELISMLEGIGFEIILNHQQDANLNHMLIKKPGEIEYIKAASILGKHIDRPTDIK